MIKKLIFDLDNTLILWKDKYQSAMKNTIEHFNLDIDYKDADNLVEIYEEYYDSYKIENLIELFKQKLNITVDDNFINYWLDELGHQAEDDLNIKPVLEYLSKKYELVVLTNWFTKTQTNRLKTIGIDKYFTNIIGGEDIIKPNKNAYLKAIDNNSIEECIMIGDNLDTDIKGAVNIGMKAILVDINNKYMEDPSYIKINNIHELKEML